MNFIACEGAWAAGASGELLCTGTFVSITGEEIRDEFNPGLTDEEAQQLIDATMGLFAVVFVFLVLKKVL